MNATCTPARQTNLAIVQPEQKRSSNYIVDFLLDLFGIPRTDLTNAINLSFQELDNLAISTDTKIDSGGFVLNCNLLESNVKKCLLPISGFTETNFLFKETMKCVQASLIYNTKERHLVYNFKGKHSSGKTTMWYLYPLFQELMKPTGHSEEKTKEIFLLVTNYIQFLDDVCDVLEDINMKTTTPATIHYNKLRARYQSLSNSAIFGKFFGDVECRAGEFFSTIVEIANSMPTSGSIPSEWNLNTQIIETKKRLTLNKNVEGALLEFKQSLPGILCYIN